MQYISKRTIFFFVRLSLLYSFGTVAILLYIAYMLCDYDLYDASGKTCHVSVTKNIEWIGLSCIIW